MNKVFLTGNVGRNVDFKSFDNGGSVANTSLATTERWIDKDSKETKEHTEWHNLVFQNKRAETARDYIKQGTRLLIEGKLRTKSYEDSNGVKKYMTEVVVTNFEFISAKKDDSSSSGSATPPPTAPIHEDADDLPF